MRTIRVLTGWKPIGYGRCISRTEAVGFGLCLLFPLPGLASFITFGLDNYVIDLGWPVDAPVFDAQGALLRGRPDYLAELWGGATPDSLAPAFDSDFWDRRRVFASFGRPGYFSSYAQTAVEGDANDSAWLQVRVWDTRLGATYEEVVARGWGGYGESPVFRAKGTSPSPLPGPPSPLIGLQSFSIRPVIPEPSIVVLLAAGLVALGWPRRIRSAQLAERLRDAPGNPTPDGLMFPRPPPG